MKKFTALHQLSELKANYKEELKQKFPVQEYDPLKYFGTKITNSGTIHPIAFKCHICDTTIHLNRTEHELFCAPCKNALADFTKAQKKLKPKLD